MSGYLFTHLWQSTWFALAAAGAAWLLRRHRGGARFGVWLAASLKFLVPFALLAKLGSWLQWPANVPEAAIRIEAPVMAWAVGPVIHSGTQIKPVQVAAAASAGHAWAWLLFGVWAAGAMAIAATRLRSWHGMRRVLRASRIEASNAGLAVRATESRLEPGVVGWLRPVLLLPRGIAAHLTAAELATVVAHERSHLRRRDNLWSGLHMVVETVFWFHPAVWWIGARLLRERERACDEAVLAQGHDARVYAEAILHVCRHYAESPLACVAGIGGGDLRHRVEAIAGGRVGRRLGRTGRMLLAASLALALGLPILAGVRGAPAAPRLARLFTVPVSIPMVPAMPAVVPPTPQAPARVIAPEQYADRRLLVMFFDTATMAPADLGSATTAASNWVDTQMAANDMVAMASLGNSLQVLQDFTADKAVLHGVLTNLRGGKAQSNGTEGFTADSSEFNVANADRSLEALLTICQMLAPIQQKKTLLYFSDGITRSGTDNEITLRQVVDAAVKANVVFDTIDARGLQAVIPGGHPAPQPPPTPPPPAPPAAQATNVPVVLYFDLPTMQAQDVANAVAAASAWLDKQMSLTDAAMVAVNRPPLSGLTPFTTDRIALHSALVSVLGMRNGAAPNADASLQALQSLCQMVASSPEKKAILYYSDGITRSGTDNELTLRNAVNTCVQANASIYTMDARGLPQTPSGGGGGTANMQDLQAPVVIEVRNATCETCPSPTYPEIAKHAHPVGAVVVDATLGPGGNVIAAEVQSSPNPMLAYAAERAVEGWQFQAPGIGSHVAVVTVTFGVGALQ